MGELDTSMPLWARLLCYGLGLALIAGSIAYFAWGSQRASAASDWPSADGRILSSYIEEQESRDEDNEVIITFYPRVTYRYFVAGNGFSSDAIRLIADQGYADSYDAEDFLSDYPEGAAVEVFYDPENPGDSALVLESPPWWIFAVTLMGGVWIFAGWFFGPRRSKARGPSMAAPASAETPGRCRSCGAPVERPPLEDPAIIRRASRRGGPPCPRCGEARPLQSRRAELSRLLFWIVFAAIWAVGLWLLFFA
ncbi:DUF3592 domain-containing protein [Parasphingopyxis marina]|uniref:DUF3592 domain-containing protein n=1 Tax=Parasphingopyxis marina TaxID=2761622 RepID=A0A842HU31_9SPHN|nr:DUF3592 domain-containing protein [Parasphingopyxis marina]MBC2776586.1 DUF3592 domain-containing protein [Parasphingopyxis marina]